MSDIADYVHHNAAKVSPKILHGIHHKLPQLKLEFAEIHAPKYPHLVDQLELLADVVEDYAEGAWVDHAIRKIDMQIMVLQSDKTPEEIKKDSALQAQLEELEAEGAKLNNNYDQEIPYFVIAEACFALAYAHNQDDLIHKNVPDVGYADDSSVVRTVFIENDRVLAEYCKRHGLDYPGIEP